MIESNDRRSNRIERTQEDSEDKDTNESVGLSSSRMAKNHPHLSEIEREIRRIEGQLLVAKQVCRENVREVQYLASMKDRIKMILARRNQSIEE